MGSKKHIRSDQRLSAGAGMATPAHPGQPAASVPEQGQIEVVLKCDSVGSAEAVSAALDATPSEGVEIRVIHSGVGPISKSDMDMALTGSRLIIGFNVNVQPNLQTALVEFGVEVRLYNVIYTLIEDLRKIAQSLVPTEAEEKIPGRAKVIALFKSSRKGIIVGCEVLEGTLATGRDFRVITAMGPVYTGKIDSLQIENSPVKEARMHQKVGLKIPDFNRVKLGDLIECFEAPRAKAVKALWTPKGGIKSLTS